MKTTECILINQEQIISNMTVLSKNVTSIQDGVSSLIQNDMKILVSKVEDLSSMVDSLNITVISINVTAGSSADEISLVKKIVESSAADIKSVLTSCSCENVIERVLHHYLSANHANASCLSSSNRPIESSILDSSFDVTFLPNDTFDLSNGANDTNTTTPSQCWHSVCY